MWEHISIGFAGWESMVSIPWICEDQMKAWVPKEGKPNIIKVLKWGTKISRISKVNVEVSSTAEKGNWMLGFELTNAPPSLSNIQCFGALSLFKCFFNPLACNNHKVYKLQQPIYNPTWKQHWENPSFTAHDTSTCLFTEDVYKLLESFLTRIWFIRHDGLRKKRKTFCYTWNTKRLCISDIPIISYTQLQIILMQHKSVQLDKSTKIIKNKVTLEALETPKRWAWTK